ncbi:hypothetical protein D3C71_1006570 [compost metagenome]
MGSVSRKSSYPLRNPRIERDFEKRLSLLVKKPLAHVSYGTLVERADLYSCADQFADCPSKVGVSDAKRDKVLRRCVGPLAGCEITVGLVTWNSKAEAGLPNGPS